MNQALKTIGLAALGGTLTLGMYIGFAQDPRQVVIQPNGTQTAVRNANYVEQVSDFSMAAEQTVNSVVHVSVAVERQQNPWEEFFYGGRGAGPQMVEGTGSGVIVSADGYIVTNNHVVNGAKTIKVMLNDNRQYTASLVGADPATDLALLKIEEENLSALVFGDSDKLRLGEWVLAVGNPFNLTSTVTAGIISAKGRSINIINDRSAIESFIQTDAVVNPGNSGGALVNTRGELIGINTAISTHTGSFEGYSFAVPANIVSKVVADLRAFGAVQRAFLGVEIVDVSAELAKEQDLKVASGVYVASMVEGGAAAEAGIKPGDVITNIDGNAVTKTSELLENIGRKRPGDEIAVIIARGSTKKSLNVTLRNQQGSTKLLSKDELATEDLLGAKYAPLSAAERNQYGLQLGIKVTDAGSGKLKQAGIPQGFIIVKVNNQFIADVETMKGILKNLQKGDGVLIQGFYPNGKADYFAFGL